jgi:hypothetical protein
MHSAGRFNPAQEVLAEEACRLADRLDRLDGLLAGGTTAWAFLRPDRDGDGVTLVVNSAMAEARQGALALRQVVESLGLEPAAPAEVKGGALDQLRARREARA